MGRVRTIARRTFLIGSAAVAGGVAFGVYAAKRAIANPLLDNLADGETAITPYVKITSDGITLITPRADKGQGAYSVQAVLLAEELDVELDQIKADPGPPSAAYWNTAFAPEVADFMVPGEGVAHQLTESVLGGVVKILGMQVTGGSTTVPDGFDKLRQAGAVARETLKAAAAQQSGIPIAKLKTQAGAVLLPDGSSIAYTDLAAKAASIAPIDNVPLKDPSQWRLIGKPVQRLDIVSKSTGTQNYGIDVNLEGMAYAAIKLNPAQLGPMNSFDSTEALKMRGVKAVVPVRGGIAVIADNTWRAFQAAEAVDVDWGKAPFPDAMDEHWQALSDSFTEERVDSRPRNDGDVVAALDGAETIEAEYRAPYLAHAPLEPISAVVRVNDDAVEIWTGTQGPRFLQDQVSAITGIDADKITVNVEMMGGSFGHRLESEVVKQAAEIAMNMKGTPVKLTYSREEDMTHDFARQIAMARIQASVKDGKVDGFDLGISMPSVFASQGGRQGAAPPGPDSQIVAGAWEQPFAIPNKRITGYRAPELAPISSWRSVGASTNGFFYNSALDEAIHAAGADPMEERLRLASNDVARKVLEAVAEMSSWDGVLGNGKGRGVAFTKSFGVPTAQVVEVSQTDEGIKIDKVFVAADVGVVVDPVNLEAQLTGGVVWSLGHAINCEITYTDGVADQTNYDSFEAMRLYQCPQITARGLENGSKPMGVGEPGVPPAPAALAGAIFAATGIRLREMPFNKFIDFV